jgi:magnesium transporter
MDQSTNLRITAGVLSPQFRETSSVEDALASAKEGNSIVWIGVADPATEDLARIASAIGDDDQDLAEICGRSSVSDDDQDDGDYPARAHISQRAGVAHLALRSTSTSSSGGPNLDGELEIFATQTAMVVITRGLGIANQPPAILEAISSQISSMASLTSGSVVGFIVSVAIDWYADLIDEIERRLSEIADEMFSKRSPEQLTRLYELAKPLHGATVAIQPIAHHLERILRELGGDLEMNESLGWRADEEHLANRIAHLQAFFFATLQIYVGLAQDEANKLSDERNEMTQKMSAYALLLAIPTIIFSIYGMNFKDILIEREAWGYPVIIAITAGLCGYVYLRLRRSGWL